MCSWASFMMAKLIFDNITDDTDPFASDSDTEETEKKKLV